MIPSCGEVLEALRDAARRSPDLLRQPWRKLVEAGAHPLTGHCYVVCEALWYLMGGPEWRFRPHTVRHKGSVHWYLADGDDVIDPTAEQFPHLPDYAAGRCRGFLTSKPSRRSHELVGRSNLA